MDDLGSSGDPERSGFAERLEVELRRWEREGLITGEQALAIAARYGSSGSERRSQRAHARLVSILAIFGAILVGLGIVLFFAANWDQIPKAARLAMIAFIVPAAYALSYWIRYGRQYRRVGTALLLLACIIYGAALHLVAQVYNFPVNHPLLFTLFFLGVIPMAYLTRSLSVMVLAIGVFLALIGFWLGHAFARAQYEESQIIYSFMLYAVVGLALYGLGRIKMTSMATRQHARLFQLFGVVTALGSIYLLGSKSFYEGFGSGDLIDPMASIGLWIAFFTGMAVVVAFMAGAVARQRPQAKPMDLISLEAAAVAIVLAATGLSMLIASHHDLLFPVVFNVLLLLSIVGLAVLGYRRGEQAFVNVALAFFGIGVITRYFEVSWGLVNSAAIFVGAGLLLLAGGYLLERTRRRVLQRMTAQLEEPL